MQKMDAYLVFYSSLATHIMLIIAQVHGVRLNNFSSSTTFSMIDRYHSSDDRRLPANFICLPCQLKNDVYFSLIEDGFENTLTAWANLACFRYVLTR